MVEFTLDGNSPATINSLALWCLAGVCLAAVLGLLLDWACGRGRGREDCADEDSEPPPAISFSVVLLLVASYSLLVPGLCCVLFSFNIILDFGIIKMGVGPEGGVDKVPPVTESMLGLVNLLRTTDCALGAHAVVFYAMVIPAVKLVLLVLGEGCFRSRPLGSACIHAVQSISKWACPDMFAYILLQYLVRGLNHPMMLRAAFRLDLGFTCFSIFCVASTLASLGIRAGEGSFFIFGRVTQKLGRAGTLSFVFFLMSGFMYSLKFGLEYPVMSLRVHMDDLYAPKGPLPSTLMGIPLQPIIDALQIPEKANADVSVFEAIETLGRWAADGEVNSFIALVMLLVFVVALTLLDVLVLVATGCLHYAKRPEAERLARWAAALRKLSMLDVMVMGVVVVTLCMSMYHKDGIWVATQPGLLGLLWAEVLHYVLYYAVMGAVHTAVPPRPSAAASLQELAKLTRARADHEGIAVDLGYSRDLEQALVGEGL